MPRRTIAWTRLAGDVLPLNVTVPPSTAVTCDRVQRGGLAGAVRADERYDLALVYLEGNARSA